MTQNKMNRAQSEMYIIISVRPQTLSFFKKLHRYVTCIVQMENYDSSQPTDLSSTVKSMKMFKISL